MNILLTTACDKGCSFCFADNSDKQEMTLATFTQLLDFIQKSAPVPFFKLMGGEPTTHPQFVIFVEEILKRNLRFGLITNGLYNDSTIADVLTKAIAQGCLESVLINCSELDVNNNLERMRSNYESVLPLYKTKPTFSLTGALTLSRHKKPEAELAYVVWLIKQLEIHTLRISLDFLGNNSQDTTFINNTIYGDKIKDIVLLCHQHAITPTGDCILLPCLFSDTFFFQKKLPELMKNIRTHCHDAASMPFDIYPNLSYFHCYPGKALGGKNLLAFANYNEAIQELGTRKQALVTTLTTPELCRSCSHYATGRCASLCLGCQQLESSPLLSVLS